MVSNSKDLFAIDKKYLWHPYTKLSTIQSLPLPIIERASGLYMYDVEGYRYLDAISSWWSSNLGHCHPELMGALKKQADLLEHSIIGNLSHPTVIHLSKELCHLFNNSERHVMYASDGASAIEAALKMSIQYWHNVGRPKRHKFATLTGDYHGDTLGTISVGYVESFHKPFKNALVPSFQAMTPFCRKCPLGKEESTCSVECFRSMEEIVTTHQEELAAVIVEPLCQGASGMRIYSPKYLVKLQEVCKTYGILLIIDEIAMGFGRTGKMFAHEHAHIDPDIVCVGKGLSGGTLPISATIAKNEIFETFTDIPEDNTFYHGHTFAGNPIASAVALKVLEIYKRDNIVQQAEELGQLLKQEIDQFEGLPSVDNTRCLGMIGAVELKPGTARFGNKSVTRADAVRTTLLKKGVFMRPLGNVFYLMLPLVVTKEVLVESVKTFYSVVEEIG